ncbi:MAG TPA: hypothetical protein VEA99_19020 [Gemmatimonadaceae bacterium]|nr:hypothetical protein [Gemmatimonadaceae bacterium]
MNRTSKPRAARPTRLTSSDERRSRLRLRELCDEVLASYRAARGADPISATERAEAEQLLARFGALR